VVTSSYKAQKVSSEITDKRLCDKGGRWTCYFRDEHDGDYEQRMWIIKHGKLYNRNTDDAVVWEDDNGFVMRQDSSEGHQVQFEKVPLPVTIVTVTEEKLLVAFAKNGSGKRMETSITQSVKKFKERTVYRSHIKKLKNGFKIEAGSDVSVSEVNLHASLSAEVNRKVKDENDATTIDREEFTWEQTSVWLPPHTGRFLERTQHHYTLKEGNQTVFLNTESSCEEQLTIDSNGNPATNADGELIYR